MILLAVFVVLAVALAVDIAVSAWRERRTPAELRDDWWPQFEREFRAYADRAARRAENVRRSTRGSHRPGGG